MKNEWEVVMHKLFAIKIFILSMVLLFAPNESLASNQDVTVRLSYFLGNQTEVDVRINGTYVIQEDNRQLTSNHSYRFRVEGNTITIYENDQRLSSYSQFTAKPMVYSEENFITINNRRYLGDMKFSIDSNFIRPINTVPLEDYLKGVVSREMSASWGDRGGMEALKAQAVTARTYILRRINSIVSDTEHHQVYGGYHWHHNTNVAVDATRGEVATYNGQLIDTFYSSSNGGKILSNRNVWGSTKLAYLDAKDDPYDVKTASLGNSRINWNFTIDKQQIDLSNRDLNQPDQWWNSVQEVNSNTMSTVKSWLVNRGRVSSQFDIKIVSIPTVQFTTQFSANETLMGRVDLQYILRNKNDGSFVMENDNIKVHSITINDRHDNIRAMFGGVRMLSSYVKQVEETNSTFTIHGGGWGHNIGMSQYGAYQMSREGYSYRDIIHFYYSGAQVVSPNPIFSIQLTSRTEMYSQPTTSSTRTGSLSPQTVNVFEERNGWYLIDSWLGRMWINPANALVGEAQAYKETLFINENTSLYSSPTSQSASGAISPQNVTTLRKWGDWYEINTWLGPKWIKPNAPLVGGVTRVSEPIQLTQTTRIFTSPLDSNHRSSLGAQKITATHQWGDWYRVNTWLGPMWMKPEGALIGEAKTYEERLYVTENTNFYSVPGSQSRVSVISPQNVTTTKKWGDWYEINTWRGSMWINPKSPLVGGIDRVDETISLTTVTRMFDTPKASQHRSSLGAQNVQATHYWNGWYRINTWLGPQWIKPSGTVTASLLNVRSGPGTQYEPAITQLERNTTVTVLGIVDGWYKIKHDSFDGEGYVSSSFVTVD